MGNVVSLDLCGAWHTVPSRGEFAVTFQSIMHKCIVPFFIGKLYVEAFRRILKICETFLSSFLKCYPAAPDLSATFCISLFSNPAIRSLKQKSKAASAGGWQTAGSGRWPARNASELC